MERGKATTPERTAATPPKQEPKQEPLTEVERGTAEEWARDLEYQHGPAPRARRLALAMAEILADRPDDPDPA
jgi:hypothetical protein